MSEESPMDKLLKSLRPEARRRVVIREPEPGAEPGPIEIMTVGPIQAEALRKQHEARERAERESTGEETGVDDSGEETGTDE